MLTKAAFFLTKNKVKQKYWEILLTVFCLIYFKMYFIPVMVKLNFPMITWSSRNHSRWFLMVIIYTTFRINTFSNISSCISILKSHFIIKPFFVVLFHETSYVVMIYSSLDHLLAYKMTWKWLQCSSRLAWMCAAWIGRTLVLMEEKNSYDMMRYSSNKTREDRLWRPYYS